MASVLNIAGLTLAFTAFYVMMVQVTYDLGYNRSIRDADRIWTVNANWIGGGFSLISPRGPFEAALAQCPEVEGSAIITRNWEGPVWVQKSEFSFTEYAAVRICCRCRRSTCWASARWRATFGRSRTPIL